MPLTLGRFGSPDPDRPLFAMSSVLEHLDRFRKGVIRSAIGVAVGILVAFAYINEIVEFVFRPIRSVLPPGSKMIYTVPGEAFSVYVTIALIAGIVLTSPFIMYQVWQIIAPALYVKQKRFAIWFILMTTAGFLGGAAFNHYVAFKMLMVFFASFNTTQLAFLPRLEDVFSMYTRMLFILGVVFQMPTLVFFLAKMGLVTARFLASQFKYAVLVIFIIAAVVTPSGDPYNQTILAAPMIGLYILSIFIAWVFAPVIKKTEIGPRLPSGLSCRSSARPIHPILESALHRLPVPVDPHLRWSTLQLHLRTAREARDAGEHAKARASVEAALAIDPDFARRAHAARFAGPSSRHDVARRAHAAGTEATHPHPPVSTRQKDTRRSRRA